jgi:hypothetical protein
MSYLLSGGQVIVGMGLLFLWWMAIHFLSRRNHGKQMTNVAFVVWTPLFMLWSTAGFILIFHGLNLI